MKNERRREVATLERCGSCGGTDFVDAVDNHGRAYRGCKVCRLVSMQKMVEMAQALSVGGDRVAFDMARATVAECLDCVSARINECYARGVEPEHITNIAWQMLNDALQEKS